MESYLKYLITDKFTIRQALVALNNLSNDVLTLFVVNSENKMLGTLTDGDIRRKLIEGLSLDDLAVEVMNTNFKYILECDIDVNTIRDYKLKNTCLLPCLNSQWEIVKIYNLKKNKSILPVDAVLMAGGKGERLRPLTEKTPKPLLPVGEKAIIDYNVDSLITYGVENIFVTVNYLKEQLEEHFKTERENVLVKCVREPKYLGTIGSVKFVPSFCNDTVLVMNSDLFTNIDYEDFFVHFREHDADMSVAAVPYTISVPYGIFDLNGRTIQGVQEKPVYNYYANGGIYLVKRELLSLIPEDSFFNATDFIELLIKLNKKVVRFPITGYWLDIGKHEEYNKAQELAKHL